MFNDLMGRSYYCHGVLSDRTGTAPGQEYELDRGGGEQQGPLTDILPKASKHNREDRLGRVTPLGQEPDF